MKIHPTAIIDAAADLHETVEVGPYCIIDADVQIGANTVIESSVRIKSGVRIGQNNRCHHNVVLGDLPQHLKFDPQTPTQVIIGDFNILRENVVINRSFDPATPTRMGDHNFLMCNTHLGHDVSIGDYNNFTPGALVAGHAQLGSRIYMSGLVGVHQFTRIGDLCMIGGVSKLSQDIPPFMITEGNPAAIVSYNRIGLQRAGLSDEARKAIKRAYKIIYLSGLTTTRALEELQALKEISEIEYLIRFIAESERGIADHR